MHGIIRKDDPADFQFYAMHIMTSNCKTSSY